MKQVTADFFALPPAKRRLAVLHLCERALKVWETRYRPGARPTYQETVTGSIQLFDVVLPRDALEAVREGADYFDVKERYVEPIVALSDMDFELADDVGYAYYAIYNAFKRYVLGEAIQEGLIVSQVLSALPDAEMDQAFQDAVASAGER